MQKLDFVHPVGFAVVTPTASPEHVDLALLADTQSPPALLSVPLLWLRHECGWFMSPKDPCIQILCYWGEEKGRQVTGWDLRVRDPRTEWAQVKGLMPLGVLWESLGVSPDPQLHFLPSFLTM